MQTIIISVNVRTEYNQVVSQSIVWRLVAIVNQSNTSSGNVRCNLQQYYKPLRHKEKMNTGAWLC